MADRDFEQGSGSRAFDRDYDYDYGRRQGGMSTDYDRDYGYRSGSRPGRQGYGQDCGRQGGGQEYGGQRSGQGRGQDYGRRGGQEYGRQGSRQDFEEPLTWSYTEIWLIPGPMTGKGPRNYRRSDDRICEDVSERLTQHGQIDASDIEVEVKDGEVTLKGTVQSRQQKRMAEDTADSVNGVQDVHNQLRIAQQGEQQKTQDQERRSQSQGQQQRMQNQPQDQQQKAQEQERQKG